MHWTFRQQKQIYQDAEEKWTRFETTPEHGSVSCSKYLLPRMKACHLQLSEIIAAVHYTSSHVKDATSESGSCDDCDSGDLLQGVFMTQRHV